MACRQVIRSTASATEPAPVRERVPGAQPGPSLGVGDFAHGPILTAGSDSASAPDRTPSPPNAGSSGTMLE